eukprot:5647880-Amphidinium_carterae.1
MKREVAVQRDRVKVEQPVAGAAASSNGAQPMQPRSPSNAEVKEPLISMGRSLYEVAKELKEFNRLLQDMAA